MNRTVTVIMPAFAAEPFIPFAIESLLTQTHADWELVLIGDDNFDYQALLVGRHLWDARMRFMNSGRLGSGASHARNVGLDTVTTDYVAVLDADDRFAPRKLELALAALADHPIVSTALTVVTPDFTVLRTIAEGPNRVLAAGAHKWVNFSMDTMIVWDRLVCDARYDPDLPNMTDLDFLMQLYRTAPASFHLGMPLHDYVKRPVTMSNGPGVTERMIAVKRRLLDRLAMGHYPMADAGAIEGMTAFLRLSLEAEIAYPAKAAAQPGLLFEDGFEPMIRAARR